MGWTIGRLAKRHGLSRSTLLHYDAIGLLRASGRSGGDYRVYDAADDERLAAIRRYRRAGLPLAAIRDLLDGGTDSPAAILDRRIKDLDAEIDELRRQRAFALKLLGRADELPPAGIPLDKKRWTELLRASGFSEDDMTRWHAAFERSDPAGHQRFLEFLRIPAEEIAAIRAFSSAREETLPTVPEAPGTPRS
ncbi:MerR family transcriptional regulator [Desulfovibrio aminophilus]|uniref:MerR family transcriptional regulator n=1 Tax=Desulfovibrio aminophilus TaxID=81425 RepID=UPI003399F4C8